MLELLILLSSLQINSTVPVSSLTQIPQQVEQNTAALQTTIAGLSATAVAVAGKVIYDRRNNDKVVNVGSEIDKILLADIMDNYNDFREYANLDKMILDQAMLHPDFSYAQLINLNYDVSTKETLGQRKAKYIEKINEYYKQYYVATSATSTKKNPLDATLNYVKDKTTPA